MLSSNEVSVVGQILNTNWGYSSTEPGDFPLGTAPQYSVTGNLVGATQPEEGKDCQLVVKYLTVVTFRPYVEAEMEKREFRKEATKLCRERISSLKKGFREATGRALKVSMNHDSDSCEMLQLGGPHLSMYTQQHKLQLHRAYYRYTGVYNVA